MIIGKTRCNISTTEIFSKVSEVQVLGAIFPEIKTLPCLINSPLREDKHPSFGLFVDKNNHVRYIDYAHSNETGGLLDLLCKYWSCTFQQALSKICALFIGTNEINIKPRQIKTFTQKKTGDLSKMQVVVRPWRDYDLEYWKSYGIEKQWLKYAEIYPISHKIIIKKETPTSKIEKFIFTADKYAYCFTERKEGDIQLKVYQPYNTEGYKWSSKMDRSVIGLWTKIPEYGDRVVLCSSLKDALCLSCQCHIPTLCLQGEGYGMSDTAISELKRRYKKVFICFDTDKAGKEDSKRLAERTGFINIVPDLGKEKDLSDYFKSLENKEDFKQLNQLFH